MHCTVETPFSQHARIQLPDILLAGICARTNNQHEAANHRVIGQTIARFWAEDIGESIPNQVNNGRTFAVYTDYDPDIKGDYTYFYGVEVESFDQLPGHLAHLKIPASHYQQFTSQPGHMPNVVINTWRSIWQMSDQELGGRRSFVADFEIYDDRATDPSNSMLDIFIGTQNEH